PCPYGHRRSQMAGHHAKRTILGPLAIFEFPGKAASPPRSRAFPARVQQDSPSSENPCAANSTCLCNSDSWRAGDANIRQPARQCSGHALRSTTDAEFCEWCCPRALVSRKLSGALFTVRLFLSFAWADFKRMHQTATCSDHARRLQPCLQGRSRIGSASISERREEQRTFRRNIPDFAMFVFGGGV